MCLVAVAFSFSHLFSFHLKPLICSSGLRYHMHLLGVGPSKQPTQACAVLLPAVCFFPHSGGNRYGCLWAAAWDGILSVNIQFFATVVRQQGDVRGLWSHTGASNPHCHDADECIRENFKGRQRTPGSDNLCQWFYAQTPGDPVVTFQGLFGHYFKTATKLIAFH